MSCPPPAQDQSVPKLPPGKAPGILPGRSGPGWSLSAWALVLFLLCLSTDAVFAADPCAGCHQKKGAEALSLPPPSPEPMPSEPPFSGSQGSAPLQSGTSATTLQTGTSSTMLQTGTGSTTLQVGTQSTTLQTGTDSTLIKARVEREGGPVNILILVDASQSMKENIAGGLLDAVGLDGDSVCKMEAAKAVLQRTLARIPSDVRVGLRVFGQRFDNNPYSDCQATALLVPLGTHNRRAITEAVRSLRPWGMTPLAYALSCAENDLSGIPGTKTIILISDGAESCGGDPCEYIRALAQRGIDVKIDIVGLGLKRDPDAKAQLDCIARGSGGKFYDTNTASELVDNLNVSVKQAISGKVITRVKEPAKILGAPVDLKP